jgi:hypothetical protein
MDAQKIDGALQVFGRLYPRQSSDVAETSLNTLSRLDPALVLSSSATQVLDGYVIATSETNSFGQAIDFPRVAADRAVSPVAGFYWQHLTYVGIWWLFAVLVLIAPFYDRIRDRKMRVG